MFLKNFDCHVVTGTWWHSQVVYWCMVYIAVCCGNYICEAEAGGGNSERRESVVSVERESPVTEVSLNLVTVRRRETRDVGEAVKIQERGAHSDSGRYLPHCYCYSHTVTAVFSYTPDADILIPGIPYSD